MARLLALGWIGLLLAGQWPSSAQAASPVAISEFMAGNTTSLADDDDDHPDWIELRNRSNVSVNLEGWYLTDSADQLRRWRIPSTNLPPNGYLVIFASGKDRSVPGRPLHTNFRLDAQGEYLALVLPDGVTRATEFAPRYPQQFEDISYGPGTTVVATPLIAAGTTARYLIPRDDSLETKWNERSFEDAAWQSGTTGLGFTSGSLLSGSGLYAYWPVRQTTGNIVSNQVVGGAHGVLYGAAWMTNDPVRGAVVAFAAQNGYVQAGSIPRMGVSSNFTWSFWYRQKSAPNINAVILGNRSGGAPGALQFIKFTPITFEYFHNGNIGFISHTIASGSWHHLAVVKQGTSLNYYDNGVLAGSSRVGGDIESNPLYWGGDPGAPGEYADGFIDDISLWNIALTAEQIRALRDGASPSALSGVGELVGTDIGRQMLGANASVYLRIPFTVQEGADFSTLKLRIRYDDGFIAYLNGTEAARRNAPLNARWNSTATAERSTGGANLLEEMDITGGLKSLRSGANVLAIQGLNLSAGDMDFLVLPELEAASETEEGARYFASSTPGAGNDSGFQGIVANIEFDRVRGFYDAPFTVTLTCATPGAAIRYTTDGTEPAADHGTPYQAPLTIGRTTVLRAAGFKPGYHTLGVATQSYLFLDQVLTQTGAGLPNHWGGDWQMDLRVVTNAAYAGRIRHDMKSLPIINLAMDPMEFWGPAGIYTLATGRGDAYERPCSAEMFFPDGSEPGFQVNCGVQVTGSASRTMSPKHGLGLTFKSRYGPAKLRYRVFEDSEVDEFDFLVLRPNFNMSWVRTDNSGPLNNANADGAERLHAIYVRDQFTKESQLAMGQVSAHERFVHLYINGVYWGLYNASERTDAAFAASYLGGRKDQYDAIFSDSSTVARAHDGDKNAWIEMMGIAGKGLATAEAYARIQEYLDVTNLADYMMLNFYCATVDWPWQNWNSARKREVGGQFRFFVWDAEYTLETPPWVPEDRTGVGAASGDADSPARLYHQLRSNAEWRVVFADRVQRHCFNAGALTTNQTIPRFLRLCEAIDGAIVGESARWGDVVRRSQPYTRNVEWLTEKQRLLTRFFPQRTEQVVQQFIRAGLYPELPAPELSHPSGAYPDAVQLTMTAREGIIYFTTNGRDPRLPGGAVAPDAMAYTGLIEISCSRQVLARAWRANVWSALQVASFSVADPPPALAVNIAGLTAVISWPVQAQGFVLETTDTLSSAHWTPLAGARNNQVTVSVGEGRRFYRLRKP